MLTPLACVGHPHNAQAEALLRSRADAMFNSHCSRLVRRVGDGRGDEERVPHLAAERSGWRRNVRWVV